MVATLSPEQQSLSAEDKIRLIGLLWDSLSEDQLPVPEGHLRLIQERIADFERSPDEGKSWEEFRAELEHES